MIFFSTNLIYLRKSAGWKQVDLAAKLGVKANTISNYEKGTTSPDFGTIRKITKIFGVTADELLYTRLDDGGITPIYGEDPDEAENEANEDADSIGGDEDVRYGYQPSLRRFEPMDRGSSGRALKPVGDMYLRAELDYRDEKIRDLKAQLVQKERTIMELSRQLGRRECELEMVRDSYEALKNK